MRSFALIIILILSFTSCKSSKTAIVTTKKENAKTVSKSPDLAEAVIRNAKAFEGVRYKFGGTTQKGMDCSGLVYVSFKKEEVYLPRISRDMARKGSPVNTSNLKAGDLLFFRTSKTRRTINHVGLVTVVNKKDVHFIHSTTSKGVITSSLNEEYWRKAFVEARRIL